VNVWIDLGGVKNHVRVTVIGKPLGAVWHAPYRVDATGALKPGSNEQPDATRKYTFADVKPCKATSPRLPSGLPGPVTVIARSSAK
jgi:(4-O-methyl)-D-glucuronate---lignin esterase